MISSQDKSPKAATTGTSQSTPTPPTESVGVSGLQIYKDDVQTVQLKGMTTDTIVLFFFK